MRVLTLLAMKLSKLDYYLEYDANVAKRLSLGDKLRIYIHAYTSLITRGDDEAGFIQAPDTGHAFHVYQSLQHRLPSPLPTIDQPSGQ